MTASSAVWAIRNGGSIMSRQRAFGAADRMSPARVSGLQRVAPAVGARKDLGQLLPLGKITPEILQDSDQRIERRPDLIGVRGGDVLPDIGGARRQARGIGQTTAGQRQA